MTISFETDRKYEVKKITNPDDDSQFVAVPLIKEIHFFDAKTLGQEFVYGFDNSPQNDSRQVVEKEIKGTDGSTLKVERIKQLAITDPKAQAQEFVYTYNNTDPDPADIADGADPNDSASYPSAHVKTHIRYWTDPPDAAMPDPTKEPSGANAWIKVQMIDKVALSDAKTMGQEYEYILQNPDDGSDIPSDEDIKNADNYDKVDGIDPPWRFDPFQNVVDVSWGAKDFVLYGFTQDQNASKSASWIYTSKDGNTWTKQNVPEGFTGPLFGSPSIRGMAYGAGQWLLVSSSGDTWVSTDLFKTWTKTTAPPLRGTNPGSLFSVRTASPIVAWGHPKNVDKDDPDAKKNGYFVYGDFDGKIWTSKDKGVTWASSDQDRGGGGSLIRSVNYAGGRFVVVVNDFNTPNPNGGGFSSFVSTIRILVSTDGTTWSGGTVFTDISNLTVTGAPLGGDIGYVGNHINYGVAYDSSKKTYGFTSFFSMTISDGGDSSFLAEGTTNSSTDTITWRKTAGPYGDWETINTSQGGITYYFIGQPAMGGGKFLAPYMKLKSAVAPDQAETGEWGVFTSLTGTSNRLEVGKSLDVFTAQTGQPSACVFSPIGADKEKGYVGTFVVIEQFGFNGHFTSGGFFFKIWRSKDGDIVLDTGNSPYGIQTSGVHSFVQGLVLGQTPKPETT